MPAANLVWPWESHIKLEEFQHFGNLGHTVSIVKLTGMVLLLVTSHDSLYLSAELKTLTVSQIESYVNGYFTEFVVSSQILVMLHCIQ